MCLTEPPAAEAVGSKVENGRQMETSINITRENAFVESITEVEESLTVSRTAVVISMQRLMDTYGVQNNTLKYL